MFPPVDLSPYNNLDALDTPQLRATLGAMLIGGFICILCVAFLFRFAPRGRILTCLCALPRSCVVRVCDASLSGIVTMQAYLYFRVYHKDALRFKLTVRRGVAGVMRA